MPYVFLEDGEGFDFMLEEIGKDSFPEDYFMTLMYYFDVYREFPHLDYPVSKELAPAVRKLLTKKINDAKYVPVFDKNTGEIEIVLNRTILNNPEEDMTERKKSEQKLGFPPLLDEEELLDWRGKVYRNKGIKV
jgi:hypothetical protein